MKNNMVVSHKMMKLYLLIVVSISPLNIIRLLKIYNIATLVRVVVPIVFFYGTLLLFIQRKNVFRFDPFSRLLLWIVGYATAIGILRGNDVSIILADVLVIFVAFFAYVITLSEGPRLKVDTLFKIFAPLVFLMEGFNVFIGYFFYFTQGGIYLSFGGVLVLFPFIYYLSVKNKKGIVVGLSLIFMGAKVGVIFAAATVILVRILVNKKIKITLSGLLVFLVLWGSALGLFMYLTKDSDIASTSAFNHVLRKIQVYNFYKLTEDELENFGGGRASEIIYSMQALHKLSNLPLVFGAGAGFKYDQVYHGVRMLDTHNVHFSPVCILEKIGLPLTVLFYFFWIKTVCRFFEMVAMSRHKDPMFEVMGYFCLGTLIFSFTAYAVFSSLLHWFFLGYINSQFKRFKSEPTFSREERADLDKEVGILHA